MFQKQLVYKFFCGNDIWRRGEKAVSTNQIYIFIVYAMSVAWVLIPIPNSTALLHVSCSPILIPVLILFSFALYQFSDLYLHSTCYMMSKIKSYSLDLVPALAPHKNCEHTFISTHEEMQTFSLKTLFLFKYYISFLKTRNKCFLLINNIIMIIKRIIGLVLNIFRGKESAA